MLTARPGWTVAAVFAVLLALTGPVRAAERGKDARKVYDEATAAFGLGRYAEAAEKYEQAFTLRPDPALLYNAAQSYRLAGNKARALELYRNCLRLYPDFPNAEDARNHVASLKKQLEDEQRAATTPPAAGRAPAAPTAPVTPLPASPPPEAPAAPVSPAASAMPPPVLAAPLPPSSSPAGTPPLVTDTSVPAVSSTGSGGDDNRPITQKAWFWVAVGVAIVGAGAVAIALATSGTQYPNATFGTARGN